MVTQRRALTNCVAVATVHLTEKKKTFRQAMITTVLVANSHLPTVDVWEHFYIFSSDCATAVTPMQFLSRIDRISFIFRHCTLDKSRLC